MTVIPLRDLHSRPNHCHPVDSWVPLVWLLAASAAFTILAFIGAVDLIGRVL